MSKKVDNYQARTLLLEIDECGVNLTKAEISFVAGLIDAGTMVFSASECEQLEDLHARRVANADPADEND